MSEEPVYRPLGAGQLDKKVTVLRETQTKTALGGVTSSFGTIATPWAHFLYAKGNEEWHLQHLVGKQGCMMQVRYQSALATLTNAETWIKYGSRAFKVLAVRDPEERHERLELICEEIKGWQPPGFP